jgi:hypothetical protein
MARKPPKKPPKGLLPGKVEDPGDSPYAIPFEKQCEFADSLLDYSCRLNGVSNTLLVEMLKQKSATGYMTFKTRNGRNCLMLLVVGDEDVALMQEALTK